MRVPRRMFFIVPLALAVAVAVLIGLLHTRWVRDRVLTAALARVAPDGSIEVAQLDYNLLTLRVVLHDVRLRSPGAEPYFSADLLAVRLAPGTLLGRIGLRDVELERPRFTVFVAPDGSTNFEGGGLRIEDPFPIEWLALRGLQVVWDDQQLGFSFDADGLDLGIGESLADSLLTLPEGASLRIGDRSTRIDLASGRLAWDGLAGTLDGLRLTSPAADVEATGTIGRLLSDRDLSLHADADLHLAPLGELAGLGQGLSGDLTVAADLQGTATAPLAAVSMSATELNGPELRLTGAHATIRYDGRVEFDEIRAATVRWGTVELTDVSASASVGETLSLRNASATFQGGRLAADGDIALAANGNSSLQLTWRDLPTAPLARLGGAPEALRPGALANGSVQVSWPGMVPDGLAGTIAELEVELRKGGPRNSLPVTGSARGHLEAGTLRSSGRLVASGTGQADFDFTLAVDETDPWASGIAGSVSLQTTDLGPMLDRLAAMFDQRDPLPAVTGAASLAGTLGGTIAAPVFTGQASLRQLTVAGSSPIDAEAALAVNSGDVALHDLTAHLGLAEFSGAIRSDLAGTAVAGSLRGSVPEIADLLAAIPPAFRPEGMPEVRGSVDFDVTLAGPLPVPAFAGTVTAHAVQVEGLAATFDGSVRMRQVDGATLFDELSLRTAAGHIEATGTLEPSGMSGEISAQIEVLDLATLLGNPGLASVGALRSTLDTRFDLDTRAATLRVSGLSLDLPGFPVEMDRPAMIRWDAAGLSVDAVQVWVGNTTLAIDGAIGPEEGRGIGAVLEGDLSEFDELAGLAMRMSWPAGAGDPPGLQLEGSLRAELELGGTLQALRPSGAFTVSAGQLRFGDLPAVQGIDLRLRVDPEMAILSNAQAQWQGVTLTASAQSPLVHLVPDSIGVESSPAPIRASLQVASLTPRALSSWLPAGYTDGLQGMVSAAIDVSASRPDIESITAQAVLTDMRLSYQGTTLEQTRPTRLDLAGGILKVVDWEWVPRSANLPARGLALGVSGTVDLRGPEPTYALSATGDMRLSWLAPLVTTGLLDGRALFGAEIAGSGATPEITGSLQLEGVNFTMPEPRLALSGLAGTVTFADRHVSTEGLRGIANDGDVLVLLEADLTDLAAPTGLLGITGRGVALQTVGARAEADIDLTISARGVDDLRAFGTITLQQGGYRSARSLVGELRSFTASTARPAVTPSEPGLADRLELDIRVRTAEDLVIDTTFANLGLALDLRTVGTAARPGLLGTARMQEGGRFRLGGADYSIERGLVEFADPARIAPRLDIQAGTRISRYDVDVTISGDAFAPSISATSPESSLSEADVLSLMATGRTLQEAGGQGSQILREQAFAALTGQLQGVTRALGIDSVRLEREQSKGGVDETFQRSDAADLFPRTTDLATRITFARSFGELFALAFSQNLGEAAAQSWIGTVALPRRVQVQVGTFDDGTRSAELRQQLSFGGPARPASRPRPRVGTVEVTGETVLPLSELRKQLRLEPGDRFDYIDWQRDQDRLLQLYRQRGYREARVRPRRASVPPGAAAGSRIDLSYEVTAGPQTKLNIVGAELPGNVLDRMHAAWDNTFADGFLLSDLEQVARTWLVRQGMHDAVVSAEVVSVEPLKEIVVSIEPGARSPRSEVVFSGNSSISSGELRSALAAEGLREVAWDRPEIAAAALTTFYRQRGYLAAEVTVEPPRFEASRAVLTVRVHEGPPARLAAVRLEGTRNLEQAELLAAAGLTIGAVYVPFSEEGAASALLSRYFEAGFNSARVLPAVSVSPDGTEVEVVLQVVEGPRQVLAEVAVDGRGRTRASVVNRALGVVVGAPIGTTEVERLRRRLLDTGAFRAVTATLEPMGTPADGDQPVRLRVTLQETPTFDLTYGFQLLDLQVQEDRRERKPGLGAILSHRNFLGVGATASVQARVRSDEVFGRSSLSFRRLFGLPIRTSFVAQQAHRDIASTVFSSVRRTETVLQFQQTLSLGSQLSLGYSYNYERSRTAIADSPFQPPPITVTRLVPNLVYDSRDDLLNPSRGWFHASTLELALDGLGSELLFRKYSAQQYAFIPFGPAVSATAIRFGTGVSLDPASSNLPPSELFRAGGATTVRGYPQDSLGSTPFFGSYFLGGDALLILNQELRVRALPWFEGVAFVDAGSSFTSLGEMRLSGLKASTGAGIRLLTPYITLRLDYAIRLSDLDIGPQPSRGRFHFGIGHVF